MYSGTSNPATTSPSSSLAHRHCATGLSLPAAQDAGYKSARRAFSQPEPETDGDEQEQDEDDGFYSAGEEEPEPAFAAVEVAPAPAEPGQIRFAEDVLRRRPDEQESKMKKKRRPRYHESEEGLEEDPYAEYEGEF